MAVKFWRVNCTVLPTRSAEVALVVLADDAVQAVERAKDAYARRGVVLRERVHSLQVVAGGILTKEHIVYANKAEALSTIAEAADDPEEILANAVKGLEAINAINAEYDAPHALLVYKGTDMNRLPEIHSLDKVAMLCAIGWAVYLPKKLV